MIDFNKKKYERANAMHAQDIKIVTRNNEYEVHVLTQLDKQDNVFLTLIVYLILLCGLTAVALITYLLWVLLA